MTGDGAVLEVVDGEVLSHPGDIVHMEPASERAPLPCCGRSIEEFGADVRITNLRDLVTCTGGTPTP